MKVSTSPIEATVIAPSTVSGLTDSSTIIPLTYNLNTSKGYINTILANIF